MTCESRPYSVALALVLQYAKVKNALHTFYVVNSMDILETRHVRWRLGTIREPDLAM
jgi:hypothetical protein